MSTDTMTATQEILPAADSQARPIVAAEPRALASANPSTVLAYAIDRGADIAHVEKLLELQMKWEANEARKAYVADMAEFKKNPPQILKDKAVGYTNRDGTFTGYKHATLGNVTNSIVEGLARHGFSHAWKVDQQQGGISRVTCTITHRFGHSESVAMEAGRDDSGKKNAIQQVASSVSYLQRYTLLLATGLATHDQVDDDGKGSEAEQTLGEKWSAKATAAPTIGDLNAIWESGLREIENAQDQESYDQFKAACNERKRAIEARQSTPGRSTRLNAILEKGRTPAPAPSAKDQDDGPPWDDKTEGAR